MTSKFTVLFWRNLVMFSLMLASGRNLFLHSSLQASQVKLLVAKLLLLPLKLAWPRRLLVMKTTTWISLVMRLKRTRRQWRRGRKLKKHHPRRKRVGNLLFSWM